MALSEPDKKLADDIFQASRALAIAMNAAAEAGLSLNVSIQSYANETIGNRVLKRTNWRPSVSVSRTEFMDYVA